MTFIIFRNYYFRISLKNLTKCNILKTFAFKNNEKFADHDLQKICFWSLDSASTIPVLGLKRVCAWKVGPWPWIFFESLAPKFVFLTPSLATCQVNKKEGIVCERHAFTRVAQQTRVSTTCNRLFSTVVEDKFLFSLHVRLSAYFTVRT